MPSVTIQEAQAQLPALIEKLTPGEELLITQQGRTVARLVVETGKKREPRKPGSAIGKLRIIEEDDSHLEDFREYMP